MQLLKSTVKIGLPRPVKLLHVTDSHLGFVDARDDDRKHALARRFPSGEREAYVNEQIAYAKENCDLLVHTGDLIDFVSHANVDWAKRSWRTKTSSLLPAITIIPNTWAKRGRITLTA